MSAGETIGVDLGGTKVLVGGYAQFEFKSKEEAIESASRFMELSNIGFRWYLYRVRRRRGRCNEPQLHRNRNQNRGSRTPLQLPFAVGQVSLPRLFIMRTVTRNR